MTTQPRPIPNPLVYTKKIETTKTTKTCTALITDAIIQQAFLIPAHAKITVGVPGKSNWSNTDLTLDETSSADIEVVCITDY